MSPQAIRFCCPHCQASIKAPARLGGHNRNCPGCRAALTIPRTVPEDAGSILVILERDDRFALGTTLRSGLTANGAYRLRQSA